MDKFTPTPVFIALVRKALIEFTLCTRLSNYVFQLSYNESSWNLHLPKNIRNNLIFKFFFPNMFRVRYCMNTNTIQLYPETISIRFYSRFKTGNFLRDIYIYNHVNRDRVFVVTSNETITDSKKENNSVCIAILQRSMISIGIDRF